MEKEQPCCTAFDGLVKAHLPKGYELTPVKKVKMLKMQKQDLTDTYKRIN